MARVGFVERGRDWICPARGRGTHIASIRGPGSPQRPCGAKFLPREPRLKERLVEIPPTNAHRVLEAIMRIVNSEQESSTAVISTPIPEASQPIRKLSVFMSVYNECWTLREIVARVLASRVGIAVELIIVDDASTDGS